MGTAPLVSFGVDRWAGSGRASCWLDSTPVLSDVVHWIESFTSSPWFYVLVFAIAMIDGFFPVVPGETTVILGGISAGAGNLNIVLIILCGALGAMAGDSVSYGVGRFFEQRMRRRLSGSEKGEERLTKTTEQIAERGGLLLITARFIPGGRTLLTVVCGLTHQPYATWFLRWDVLAGFIWATYAGGLGYIFGDWLEGRENGETIAFAAAFGTALAITGLIEVVRHFRKKRATP